MEIINYNMEIINYNMKLINFIGNFFDGHFFF